MSHGFVFFILAALFLSQSALAQSRPPGTYFGLTTGTTTFYDVDADGEDVDFDLFGILFAGYLGYHLSSRTRAEVEFSFEGAGASNSADDAEVIRGTVGGYYNFIDRTIFGISDIRPYAGLGLGFAKVDIGGIDNNAFTGHAEAGLSIPLDDDHLDLVPGVRMEYTLLNGQDGFNDNLLASQIRLGLRYYF